ncbi:MAG: lysozyme [Magnetococcales bacterium]|nr:lysozyme [Magnetococcales bacterium]NGZ29317.1 lysozyme [Magnetococcales bacterium]
MSRQICEAAIDLVKNAEGCRLTAYYCPAHIPTIGYGHTKGVTAADVANGRTITQDEADQMLASDLASFGDQVAKLVKVTVSDDQFGALVSLAFNIGTGNLAASTLLKDLNGGDYLAAADQFTVWCKGTVNGVKQTLPGLVTRRAAERALFLSGTDQ